jgi:hypothetical protein
MCSLKTVVFSSTIWTLQFDFVVKLKIITNFEINWRKFPILFEVKYSLSEIREVLLQSNIVQLPLYVTTVTAVCVFAH